MMSIRIFGNRYKKTNRYVVRYKYSTLYRLHIYCIHFPNKYIFRIDFSYNKYKIEYLNIKLKDWYILFYFYFNTKLYQKKLIQKL